MRKLITLFLLDFRLLTKNKWFYLKLILFPSLLILILGTAFGGSDSSVKAFDVAFYNADKSVAAQGSPLALGKSLKNVFMREDLRKVIHLQEAASYDEGKQRVEDGHASVFIYVPDNFTNAAIKQEAANLVVIGESAKTLQTAIVRTILEQFCEQLNLLNEEKSAVLQFSNGGNGLPQAQIAELQSHIFNFSGRSPDIPTVSTQKDAVPVDAIQYYSIAMVVMFSIMTAFVLVHSIVDERQNHTLFRIRSTPAWDVQYVLGKLSGIILAIVLQMSCVILISWLVFAMSWGQPLELLMITVVYAFAIGSLVLLWGFIAKDHTTVSSLASPVLYIFSFLGGSFVSRSELPESLRIIQGLLPNGKAINAYLSISQNNGLAGSYKDLLELIGLGVICIIVCISQYSGRRWSFRAIYHHAETSAETDI
ncbi:ABC transporter permease [Paenibacillus sp. FSL L8-0470]|uniref:ABC transporter permease n=1 Tax=Paenibacillus sp. FSL L8-0470 TaxID=2954688 RepID=UPI0030F60145